MTVLPTVLWVIFGVCLAAADIFAGSIFLLMMACAAFLASLASWMGAAFAWQLSIFSFVSAAGVFLAKRIKTGSGRAHALQHLDIGKSVKVDLWHEDRTSTVMYRGAPWQVFAAEGEELRPGMWKIARVDGTRLVVSRTK